MDSYASLVEGYKDFRGEYLAANIDVDEVAPVAVEAPRTLVIGCTDCQVDPTTLTHAGFGEVFSVNSVASIVPPYVEGGQQHVSIGAVLQHALEHQHVEHIIIMGHSGCAGIAALMAEGESDAPADPMQEWLSILKPAKDAIKLYGPDLPKDEQLRLCEMEAALVSIANLAGYPLVRRAVKEGRVTLHAWYLHEETRELLSYRPEEGRFRRLIRS